MLDVQVQQDFSAGMFQSPARELVPANGCARILNGLLEVDGSVTRRGGCVPKASLGGVLGAATFLWDGYLFAGPRTAFGDGSNLGALTAADNAATAISTGLSVKPLRPAVGNGTLLLVTTDNKIVLWAGARAPTYSTGTITQTTATSFSGSGTSFVGNVEPGSFLSPSGDTRPIRVEAVVSNTVLTVSSAYTGAGPYPSTAYTADPVKTLDKSSDGVISAVATISNPARLVYSVADKVLFTSAGSFTVQDPTDYHLMPQGAQVLGMESLRNVLFVFTTQGVFTISGMDYDLTDQAGNVQHRVEQINRDVILWDQRGIAGWAGALVVPGTEDVYLLTDSAAPRALSEPIRSLYRGYVAAGYQCGGATVYRNHYFLPILNGTTWVDTLVCRLDAGGWTQWSGTGGQATWMTTRGTTTTSRSPLLLSVYGSGMLNLTGTFSPTSSNSKDQSATGALSTHPFEVVTRDYTTAGLRKNLVKKVRLGYELTDAAADAPTITAQYATGNTGSYTSLAGSAPVSDGQAAQPFTVGTVRPRFVRFRFSSTSPAARMQLKSVEVFSRLGGAQ